MIHTIPDMLNELARALDQQDHALVDIVESAARSWLQPERERAAQLNLIESVRNAIDCLTKRGVAP